MKHDGRRWGGIQGPKAMADAMSDAELAHNWPVQTKMLP